MEEKEYGIKNITIRRGLDTTLLVIENTGDYAEDYQMRMMEENNIKGVLCPAGHGEEGVSIYEYDISGKISLKSKFKENKIDMEEMIKFISELMEAVNETENYLLNADCLLLDPQYIFWEDGNYLFCYYPCGKWNIWEAFHRLTEYFVQWTDYQDDASVKISFLLHKETMKENYSLNKIARQLEKIREERMRRGKETDPVPGGPERLEGPELSYDTAEHDWIAKQEMGSSIMRETENMWKPVRNFLRRHKKPAWRGWDGIYIDEEEL